MSLSNNAIERLREFLRPYYLRHVYFPLRPSRRPPEFERCWRVPHEFEGGPPRLHIPPPHPELADVLLLPMTDWHHRLQRSQRLAISLAQLGRRCFLLNPHLGREYPQAPWCRRPPAMAQLDERVFELHAPLPSEPVFHHRLLLPSESRSVAAAAGWALRRAGAQRLDIVFALPTWTDCALELRRRWQALLAYDCHDWLAGFPNMAPAIAAAEPGSLLAADLVLFCSQPLADAHLSQAPLIAARARLLGNGLPDWPPPPPTRQRQPVVGYVGALEPWFWSDAVLEAARQLPAVQFRLAGDPCPAVRAAFAGQPNVTLLGEIPPSAVPEFLSGCRIGLIPRTGSLSRFMAPIKVFEYFWFGLPVVSGTMPDLDRFGSLVFQASTPDAFARAVREALEEDNPAREEARRAEAQAATWSRRAAEFNQMLLDARAQAR